MFKLNVFVMMFLLNSPIVFLQVFLRSVILLEREKLSEFPFTYLLAFLVV